MKSKRESVLLSAVTALICILVFAGAKPLYDYFLQSDLDAAGFKVKNLGSPSAGGDAVTLTYFNANNAPVSDGDKGDITISGSGATFTIDADAVTYSKLQNVSATQRVLGRNTAGSGDPEEVTLSQLLDWVGSAAQGDILYRGASGWLKLAAGTAGHFLKTQGAGADPLWASAAISDGDKGDITVSGSGTTFTIDADAVSYSKLQNVSATQRVLGRNTAGSGDPEEVTLSQLLDWVGSAAQGDVLYRGASGWTKLTAGTAGHFLQTQGAGADPLWASAGGGKSYIVLTHPDLVDGTGATLGTTSTSINYGRPTFSNSADQSANYCEYYFSVPTDIDTSVAMRAILKIRLGGADTGTHRYVVSMASVNVSADPTTASLTNAVNLDFAGDASGANGDLESVGYSTLTSWAGSVTADRLFRVRLARDGNDAADASTVNSTAIELKLEYKTQ